LGALFLPLNYDADFGNAAVEHLPNPYNSTVILDKLSAALVLEGFKIMPAFLPVLSS